MRIIIAVILAVLSVLPAAAETWPSKPVKVVVTFGPGTATDTIARALAGELAKSFGQPFVIVNRGGANGTIGGTEVVRAAPDGYTLMVGSNTSIVAGPLMRKEPPYDTLKDLTPISFLCDSTFFLAAHPTVPAKTLQEFIAYAKANPGKINYASGNTTGILSTAFLNKSAGSAMLHVPYKWDPEALPDLLSGQVQFIIATSQNVLPHAKVGKLKLFATALRERSPLAPDVPSIIETGQPEFPIGPWAAFLGPAGLPADIVERLAAETAKAMAKPEILAALEPLGIAARTTSVSEFRKYLEQQVVAWRLALKESGIEPE
jgi:tripartite-type tricarboxylate transporter receptor subunit TctC